MVRLPPRRFAWIPKTQRTYHKLEKSLQNLGTHVLQVNCIEGDRVVTYFFCALNIPQTTA